MCSSNQITINWSWPSHYIQQGPKSSNTLLSFRSRLACFAVWRKDPLQFLMRRETWKAFILTKQAIFDERKKAHRVWLLEWRITLLGTFKYILNWKNEIPVLIILKFFLGPPFWLNLNKSLIVSTFGRSGNLASFGMLWPGVLYLKP